MQKLQPMFVSITAACSVAIMSEFYFCSMGKAGGALETKSRDVEIAEIKLIKFSASYNNQSEKFDIFIKMIDDFFANKSRDIGDISKKFDDMGQIVVPINYALDKMMSDKFLLKIHEVGDHYVVRFKGDYRSSPVIGFSLERLNGYDKKLGIVTLPFASNKMEK